MNEPKKPIVKRKLTLNRETLRAIESDDTRLLDAVVGGRPPPYSDGYDCWTIVSSCLTDTRAC